jgi:hypothetical protein
MDQLRQNIRLSLQASLMFEINLTISDLPSLNSVRYYYCIKKWVRQQSKGTKKDYQRNHLYWQFMGKIEFVDGASQSSLMVYQRYQGK